MLAETMEIIAMILTLHFKDSVKAESLKNRKIIII